MRNQSGDTIVEVLISIVVVAAVLAGAFVSARRSLDTTIRSRERDEAVKLAQIQVEQVRPALDNDTLPADPKTFCLSSQAGVTYKPNNTSSLHTTDTFDASQYHVDCVLDLNGDVYNANSEGNPFHVAVKRNPSGSDDNLFKVTVFWDRVGGGGLQQAELVYRTYSND